MSLSPEALAALRQDYSQRGLDLPELNADPIQQFQAWLKEAHACGVLEPNAMTLCTVDTSGQPWTRTVLLKVCDPRGFAFFTNYAGTKAVHLEGNPRAALTFWWGALERQVNVTGRVEKTSAQESDDYFAVRPLASQIGAWASPQSRPLESRAALEKLFEEQQQRFAGGLVPRPDNWGGYVLAPDTIEFWQGRRSRLHDRFLYQKTATGEWQVTRLAP